ncbi:MAG: hypothetical protein HOV80_08155 [Polyangiaceae bacterium]|nr:hypothetical protein [Polyangiaceae bacterium]
MPGLSAIIAFSLTLGLVLFRPKIGRLPSPGLVAPVAIGIVIMLAGGAISTTDVAAAFQDLAKPLLGLTCICVSAGLARSLGLIDRLAHLVVPAAKGPVYRAFGVVFAMSFIVAAIFNNDAAVLALTPMVIALLRRLYPIRRDQLLEPFAFAVFAAAGVAPLVISNPMNFVVATIAGIGFNAYAVRMVPVAILSSSVAYLVLRAFYRRELYDEAPATGTVPPPAELSRAAREAGFVLAVTLLAFPVVTAFGGPVLVVSFASAATLVVIALARGAVSPREIAAEVPFPILGFLLGMFVLVRGLENAGAVAFLQSIYATLPEGPARIFGVGGVSSIGSALLNNHPMALLNAVALAPKEGGDPSPVLAALVGGDLGPRLLPTGSLAGLLWLEWLRREGVAISLRRYVMLGIIMTIPSLFVGLAVLILVS